MENHRADLYQIMNAYSENQQTLATVLDGEFQGEKILLDENSLLYSTNTHGILNSYINEIRSLKYCTILEKDCRIFCEKLTGIPHLVLLGAGHVSIAVLRLARRIGFHTVVLENRQECAENAKREGADDVICMPYAEGLKKIQGNADTYFVILTSGHCFDELCIQETVQKPNAYVGVMGKRDRVRDILTKLESQGIKKELLEQVHSPIGLNIHAKTPDEIAVSIMAEIIQTKNSLPCTELYGKDILEYLSEREKSEKLVLATLVSKQDATPRETGTKMLILPDGRQIGTIGGGSLEGEVLKRAKHMLGQMEHSCQLFTYKQAKTDISCGGGEEIFLELM